MSFASVSVAFGVLGRFLRGMPNTYAFRGSFSAFIFAYQRLIKQIYYMHSHKMNAQGAATIAFSLATAWIRLPRKSELGNFSAVFTKVMQVVTQQGGKLDAQSVAAAMWAMEKTKYKDYKQYTYVIDAAFQIEVDEWRIENICKVLWCLGNAHNRFPMSKQHVRHKIYQLSNSLLPPLIPELKHIPALDIGKIMCSLRRLRIYNQPFMSAVEEFLVNSTYVCNFRNSTVCQICLAFADLGISLQLRNRIVMRLTQQFFHRFDGKSQHIANMIYALGIIGCKAKYARKVIDILLKQNNGSIPPNFFNEIELLMIRRAQLQLRETLKQNLQLPSDLEKQCTVALQEKAKFQREEPFEEVGFQIHAAVLTIFPNAVKRVTILNDEFFAHVQFFDGVQFVVVDITSPCNYLSNIPDQIINSLRQQHLLLESAGYRVVVVNNYRWKLDEDYKFAIIKDLQTPRVQQQQKGSQKDQSIGKDKQQPQQEKPRQKFSLNTELERWSQDSSSQEDLGAWQDLTIDDLIN